MTPSLNNILIDNTYLLLMAEGVLAAAARRSHHVTFFLPANWEEARANLPAYTDGRCDGLILVAPHAACEITRDLAARGLPAVLVHPGCDSGGLMEVDVDDQGAFAALTRYLLQMGHRRLALLTWEAHWANVRRRRQGFLDALAEAGLAAGPGDMAETDSYDEARCRRLLQDWMARPPLERPTAILCANDHLASMMTRLAAEIDLPIPEQLSVAGFDDAPFAATSHPPLTTMRQPLTQIGGQAVRLLLARIEGEAIPEPRLLVPTELVVRESVAPPPPWALTPRSAR